MPVLENPRHEAFAQGLASGLTAVEAYERAGYRGGGANAWRLHGREEVRARELQEITSDDSPHCVRLSSSGTLWCKPMIQ